MVLRKNEKKRRRTLGETNSATSSELQRPYKSFLPVVGYGGFGKRVTADNLHGSTYQTIRALSDESERKLQYWKQREKELTASAI